MARFFRAISAAALMMSLPVSAHAQQHVTLENTSVVPLHSQINGVDYQLTVVLPPGYDDAPQKHYPTLYVMDGKRWSQLLAVLYPRLVANAAYPPVIIVGVDYPGKTGRYQDYGTISQRYFPVPPGRGAANFLRVMQQEVIPLVERTYRADPQNRGIGGHSMGGFFTAYALLHATDTFNRFWISSPSLFYDDEVLLKDIGLLSQQKIIKPVFVFTDVGGDELPMMRNVLERFGSGIVQAQPGKIVLDSLVVPGADHATVVPSALAPALEHLFAYRPQITPLPADMLRFAGQYKLPSGTVLTFVTDGSRLLYRDTTVDYETGSLVPLMASAPNRFYRRYSSAEYEFPLGVDVPSLVKVIDLSSNEVTDGVRQAPQDRLPVDKVTIGTP